MKTLKVPAILHEFFGKKIFLLDLCLTLLFGIGMSALILIVTHSQWLGLDVWKRVLLAILAFDITGGVLANFTSSTNQHYQQNARARLIFISIHLQPVALGILFFPYIWVCFSVWGYTITAALLINHLVKHPGQRTIAAFLATSGICILLLSHLLPTLLSCLLCLYMFKVVFAFAVDHDNNNCDQTQVYKSRF
ncbi:hypothetical protein PJ311_15505 [Bacillus sp. CLL-7-23]|uniref:Yip1 domain-containing protein n=1 Tax=Bacillus changyiensis TaxID=3004103 RepID=A0ABT4X6R3_9BACI|nr:hypothetical protein [Bacillus changyiensis]MDA7027979.1 hypothetical protein [Bacillus changyiensis]